MKIAVILMLLVLLATFGDTLLGYWRERAWKMVVIFAALLIAVSLVLLEVINTL